MRVGGVLPYYLEEEKSDSGMTALAGLIPYVDLMHVVGLRESIKRNICLRDSGQGWTPTQMVMAGVFLNLSGGDCVDDLDRLNADAGFGQLLRQMECHKMPRAERREMERRFRKGRERAVASASAMRRFLKEFHDEQQEKLRVAGKALIPAPNVHLVGLHQVNWDVMAFAYSRKRPKSLTLDIDAVVIDSGKASALYCYEGHKGYQPLNVYLAELGLVAHSEFRDVNVPAGYDIQRVTDESLEHLLQFVDDAVDLSVRSDTAAYNIDYLRYLHSGGNGRLKDAEGKPRPVWFAIGVDVTASVKEASARQSVEWKPLLRRKSDGTPEETKQEWAVIPYVPESLSRSKKDPDFQFIAIREVLEAQLTLPGLEEAQGQRQLPFPTVVLGNVTYKLHVIVTNRDWEGDRAIWWYRERCGKSEEIHAAMQYDFAGAKMPSDLFGADAAWWGIMVLAMNLNQIMKRQVLGGKWAEKRAKAIRHSIINLPGRVVERGRQWFLRLAKGDPGFSLLTAMRQGVAALAAAPG
jgi:hypothetical protein